LGDRLYQKRPDMDYVLHIAIVLCVFAVLAKSMDLLAGQAGILSVAHAGSFGIGAYTCVILVAGHYVSWPVGVVIGSVFGGLLSIPVALPSLRLSGDYFVLSTFAFQMVIVNVLNSWVDLTNGPLGISGIPVPSLFGLIMQSRWEVLLLVGILAVFAVFILDKLRISPFGRLLRAFREDEYLARSCGRAPTATRLKCYVIACGIAAAAGGVYAHYLGYIDPSSFSVMSSILILAMVIIGGPDSRWGPLLGAAVLVLLPECLRFLGMPDSIAAKVREMMYGAMLVLVILVRVFKRSKSASVV
jgi:branched-chain amino acid transport system permease protein